MLTKRQFGGSGAMTRRRWLCASSGALWVMSGGMALRCWVLLQPKPKSSAADVERQFIDMTNQARQAAGLMPLYPHPALTDVARVRAEQTAGDKSFDKPPSEQWLGDKLRQFGYDTSPMRFGIVGGVVYRGPEGGTTISEAHHQWIAADGSKSQPEERSILNPYFADVGAGVFLEEATGAYFVALVFGKRKRLAPATTQV